MIAVHELSPEEQREIGAPWPYRCPPRPDELLSSWILRTAHGLGIKPFAFVDGLFGRSPPVLTRDIDNMAAQRVIGVMAAGSGTAIAAASRTHLSTFEGSFVEAYALGGRNAWVMPVGVRHRERRQYGLQYCADCLASPPSYYRRAWRLAFTVGCATHGRLLRDRCPACQSPLMPHRAPALHLCWRCDLDLSTEPARPYPPSALLVQRRCERAATQGWAVEFDTVFARASAWFALVRQLARIVASGRRSDRLRAVIARRRDVDPQPFPFGGRAEIEFLPTTERARLLAFVDALLEGWPMMFAHDCAEAGVWKTWALRDLKHPPYAYADAVSAFLDRSFYKPSLNEVASAAQALDHAGQVVNRQSLRRAVGDSEAIAAYYASLSS